MAYRQLVSDVRFGSLAALRTNTSLMSASGGKAATRKQFFRSPWLNVCFSQKRSFKPRLFHDFERLLSAKSGLRGAKRCTCAGRRAIPSPAESTHRLLGRALPADVVPEPLAVCRRLQFRSAIALGVTSSTIRSRLQVTPHQPRLLTAWLS